MDQDPHPEVYQLHVWIRQISPMIWRRFLIRSDSTLTDLHNTLPIAFGWSDFHLHRFRIRSQDYSIGQAIVTDLDINGDEVKLADFRFRLNERFLYEYDFGDWWQHEVRVERHLPLDKKRMGLIRPLLEWLTLDQFDRRKVNRCLKQYALGDDEWMWE